MSDLMVCEHCGKAQELCICDAVTAVAARTRVLILQHPQEPREALSSAVIVKLALSGCVLRVGLSWRNLGAALGEAADAKKWGVLFLGTKKGSEESLKSKAALTVLSPKGKELTLQLEGVVALDGTWQQAKTLWWRNPWLLKLNRIVLAPREPSLYGKMRREPRPESLSTLEAVAFCLSRLEDNPAVEEELLTPFRALIERFKHIRKGR